ncbi:endolytic transglycosylase MltG, partial [Clostridium sp.]|uniref:endolytic transglycosylase MltG n=1 Tax=Clostridium sp. TaxID=1506 RepID=UPI00262D81A2
MKEYKLFRKLILLFIIFAFCIGFIIVISYNKVIEKPLKSDANTIIIEVKQGEGFNDILNKLDKENNLSNKLLLKVKLAIDKTDINLREGIYEIDTNTTLANLINSLENSDGDKDLVKLTIPEGYSIEEIASTVEEKGLCSKVEFLKAVKNYELPKYVKSNDKKRYNLEGFLYPDTYLIEKNCDANYIIKIMLNRF